MKRLATLLVLMVIGFTSHGQTALNLDGIDDSIDFGYHNDFGITDEITVECWVRQAADQLYPAYVSGYADSISGVDTMWTGWWLGGQDDGTVAWWIADPTALPQDGVQIASTASISDATWHHLAATFDGDSARLYLDGTYVGGEEILEWSFNVDGQITAGVDDDAEWYNGGLEDVRIWNYARSQADIDFWKDKCLTGNEAGLVAFYHFEEGSGSTSEDLTPNTNDATLYGTIDATWVGGLYCTYCDIKDNTGALTTTECVEYTSPSGNYTWTTTGIYMDTIPNVAGCDSALTIDLTINAVDVSTSLVDVTVTVGEVGATYQWWFCDGSGNLVALISGETNQSYTALADATVACIVDNGCIDTSACVQILFDGIQEFKNDFSVYPNPSNGHVKISLESPEYISQILLLGIDGKEIRNKTFDAVISEAQLTYNDVSDGMYFICLIGDSNAVIGMEKIQLAR